MNKKIIVVIIGFLWVAISAGMIISKQHTLRTGKTVVLETVPVDPRDFLRGDYVVLRYKLSSLDLNQIESDKPYYRPGENIYVKLKPKGKYWEAADISGKKEAVADGTFLKGKVRDYDLKTRKLEAAYGIESYFVPEGEGKVIVKNMRGNKSSVSVEVLVDSSGSALIKKVYIEM